MIHSTPKRGPGRPRVRDQRPNKKTSKLKGSCRFTFSLSADQKATLDAAAEAAGVTAAEFARQWIDSLPRIGQ